MKLTPSVFVSKQDQRKRKKDKPFKFLYVVFAILFAIIGFLKMNENIGGKIFGSIIMIGVGIVVAFIVDFIINITYRSIYRATKKEKDAHVAYKAYRKSTVAFIVKIVLCILLAILTLGAEYTSYHESPRKYYDKYGYDYYNEEDRDKANFLYDAYDAADDYKRR